MIRLGHDGLHVVTPNREPLVGGVLFLHWFDPQADDGNKMQFASEAKELAEHGVASVLPQLEFRGLLTLRTRHQTAPKLKVSSHG